jgi:HK97 gp10 family phage protein
MSDINTFSVDISRLKAKLNKLGDAAADVLGDAVNAGAKIIEAHAKINLENRPLKTTTGNLKNSIQSQIDSTSRTNATASVGPRNVVYAAIQEFGGIINAREGGYLRFQIDGQWITVRSVTIPARPYLRPALDENKDEIREAIMTTLDRRIQEVAQ